MDKPTCYLLRIVSQVDHFDWLVVLLLPLELVSLAQLAEIIHSRSHDLVRVRQKQRVLAASSNVHNFNRSGHEVVDNFWRIQIERLV